MIQTLKCLPNTILHLLLNITNMCCHTQYSIIYTSMQKSAIKIFAATADNVIW